MKLGNLPLIALVASVATAPAATVFSEDSSTLASWSVDRYAPYEFTQSTFDGDQRIRLTVSGEESAANRPAGYGGSFYDTQGMTVPIPADPAYNTWTISVHLYVTQGMLTGNALSQTSFWVRSDSDGTEDTAEYFIIGLATQDDADPYNPDSAGITTSLRTWDSDIGYTNHSTASLVVGWNTLDFLFDSSGVAYRANGTEISHDSTVNPGFRPTDVFLQGYNYGTSGTTDFYYDNLLATAVPEPVTAFLGSVGMMGLLRRRRF